jgi:hypothetical protein
MERDRKMSAEKSTRTNQPRRSNNSEKEENHAEPSNEFVAASQVRGGGIRTHSKVICRWLILSSPLISQKFSA